MPARTLAILGVLLFALLPRAVHAQQPPTTKDVKFEWDAAKRNLFIVDLGFREVIDANILRKLSRGLPTTIVFTATVYRPGVGAVSTTGQTCKVTFHVWDEVYIIERTRPGRTEIKNTLVPEGVLRHCTDVKSLLAGTSSDVLVGAPIYLQAVVQVNPVSPEVLDKIKRWVSRPSGTGTASPGDALFSTFTGLFLQRIAEAERELKFSTKLVRPRIRKPRTAR